METPQARQSRACCSTSGSTNWMSETSRISRQALASARAETRYEQGPQRGPDEVTRTTIGQYRELLAGDESGRGRKLKDVRVSTRLTESRRAVCHEARIGRHLARILKPRARKYASQAVLSSIRHAIVKRSEAAGRCVRRMGGSAIRSGAARRGRPARRPGRLRQAQQRADARPRGEVATARRSRNPR